MRVRYVALFFIIIAFAWGVPAHATDSPGRKIAGVIEGEGSTFQIADSSYLNISVTSTEIIKARIESVPRQILMKIGPASAPISSTNITITGLVPDTTYYKYEDNYHNLDTIVSDESGAYTYAQNISKAHLIFIQAKKSTHFIRDDETGGDCSLFGTWDPATLVCTLTTDLDETTEIDSNGITLDGGGHTTTGSYTGTGVYLDGKSGVTIKNLTIKDFSYGIFLNASSQFSITNNTIYDAETGVISFDSSSGTLSANTFINAGRGVTFFNSDHVVVEGNTITGLNDSDGLFFFAVHDSTISQNTFSNLSRTLFLFDSSDTNNILGNTFSDLAEGLFLFDSSKNIIANNTFSGSDQALALYDSSIANKIYHNNFINNGTNAMDYSDTLNNSFNLPKPAGGNYFDSFDESAEGCIDSNSDGFCDSPYVFNNYFNGGQDNFPWTTKDGWGEASVTIPEDHSSVLFLPGIEGSRLYEGTGCGKPDEEKLWEPFESIWGVLRGAGDEKVRDLFLDDEGESVCDDVYVKEGDVIDSVGGGNIYKSFIDEMNVLKDDGTIADWKPVAYDWRLSLDDLLNNGAERDGKIYYEEATSTPYIEQTLRELAASSQTGKVTIVAHSNGGLLAKALLNQLGGETAKLLVDKVIMVGAPQSGAPADVGALLYGLDQGISSWGISILDSDVAQKLAENSPMAYHLLPSEDYLESTMGDANHPVARFVGDAYASEISVYGTTIANRVALDNFLLSSTTLNSSLISYANGQHATLDSWTPPEGIEVDQIAGWGADTVAGIDFYTLPPINALSFIEPQRAYRPIFTEDGDGTVPIPSALMMASSANVKRYWLDLANSSIKHANIFENSDLRTFLKNIITNSTSSPPATISESSPSTSNAKKLTFFLHSPLTLQLTDSLGNITGLSQDDSITENIPGSSYGEFGDVKYVTVPEGGNYQLTLHGQASGTFSLDIQESSREVITETSIIANVPTTESTLATLNISNGADASAFIVDENGDGANIITIAPILGETVNYSSPSQGSGPSVSTDSGPTAAPQVISSPGSISIPVIATTVDSTSSPQATTQTVATSTLAISVHPKSLQAKKKTSVAVTQSVRMETNIPQTASVYVASQQPFLKKIGAQVYNGLYGFWSVLKKLF